MIGVGAGLTIGTGLGPGPFDVLVTGIGVTTGLPFAASLWLCAAVLAVVATVLGKRPGLGTALAPLIIGPMIGVVAAPVRALLPAIDGPGQLVPGHLVIAIVIHLCGVVLIGFGSGAMITSGLGAGTGDLLAAATSSKLGRSMPLVRTCLEVSFVGFGLILGGPVGFGTVLVAGSIGPAVRFGHHRVDGLVAKMVAGHRVAGPGRAAALSRR